MKTFPKISEKKMYEFLQKTAAANPKVTGEVLDMVPIRQKIRETERKTGCHIGHELIYGERSNGKTFQALAWSFYDCAMNGWNMSYIRATKEGFKGKNGRALFEDLSTAGVIEFVTGGEYSGVQYYAQAWYLTKKVVDDKTGAIHIVRDDTQPFCWAIALSTWQTDKGFTLPNCYIHIFDEFVRKGAADPEEFDAFEQVKSTLVRQGATDRIIMLGNTVNKFSVYFRNMRLSKVVKDMEAGDMRIVINKSNEPGIVPDAGFLLYYSDEGLKTPKKSNLFFNYGSGKTNKMITQGSWDMADYPHIGKDKRYASSEVVFTFYIRWDEEILACDVVQRETCAYIAIHRKTGGIKHPDEDLVYDPDIYSIQPNWRRNLLRDFDEAKFESRMLDFFRRDLVYYQDNEVGDMVRAYLDWCIKLG